MQSLKGQSGERTREAAHVLTSNGILQGCYFLCGKGVKVEAGAAVALDVGAVLCLTKHRCLMIVHRMPTHVNIFAWLITNNSMICATVIKDEFDHWAYFLLALPAPQQSPGGTCGIREGWQSQSDKFQVSHQMQVRPQYSFDGNIRSGAISNQHQEHAQTSLT